MTFPAGGRYVVLVTRSDRRGAWQVDVSKVGWSLEGSELIEQSFDAGNHGLFLLSISHYLMYTGYGKSGSSFSFLVRIPFPVVFLARYNQVMPLSRPWFERWGEYSLQKKGDDVRSPANVWEENQR